MAAETLAFVDSFDNATLIKHDLKRMLNIDIPILMITDSEPLFRILTRSRYTTERRLEIDIAAAREAYARKEIANVAWIHSQDNYADDLTKLEGNGELTNLLRTHTINHPVRQWIIERSIHDTDNSAKSTSEKLRCDKQPKS